MEFEQQIFHDNRLKQIVDDAVSFIGKTGSFPLPIPYAFEGSGVYLIYFEGKSGIYAPLSDLRINNQKVPIYAGKAVPPGWRQGRGGGKKHKVLHARLIEHARSIDSGAGLNVGHFSCKFIILTSDMSNLIGTLESELINRFRPVWNSCIDGFGNHDPGQGRAQQARSEWDTLHPGRYWARKLTDNKLSIDEIAIKGKSHFKLFG